MANSLGGMRNLRANNFRITVGNGEYLYAPKIGDKVGYITRAGGRELKIALKDTKYVLDINVNLISLTTVLKQGYKLIGKDGTMSIKKIEKMNIYSIENSRVVMKS